MSEFELANNYKNQGNVAFQNKEFDKALELFTKAIQLNPNDHIFWSNRSGVYASLGKFEEALEDASMCVTLKPDWAKGYARKGLALYYLGKYEEAEETYNAGLKLDPNNAQMKEGLEQVNKALDDMFKKRFPGGMPGAGGFPGGANNPFVTQILTGLLSNPETASYLQDKDFTSKLMELSQDPSKLPLHMNDPKIKKAFEILSQGFGKGKGPGAGFEEKAETEHGHDYQGQDHKHDDHPQWEDETDKKEKPEEAPKPTKTEEKPKPQPPKEEPKVSSSNPAEAEKAKGNEEYKKKNFKEALNYYEKAIELAPNEVTYYNNKAACLIEMKEFEKAIEACDKAIEISKSGHYDYEKLARALSRKASALSNLEKYDEALNYYQQSLLEKGDQKVKDEIKRLEKLKKEKDALAYINPEIANQHKEAGNELFKKGDFPAAYKEYDEAIKRNPSDAKLYSNRATCLMKLMEFPSALRDIDKAIELDPKFIKAYSKKAAIHKGLKELHKAIEAYEKGLKIDPDDAELKQGLADANREILYGGYTQSKEEAEERYRHAMADPEIQAILTDPQITILLRNMQERPNDPENMKAMKDPLVASKLNKLIAAGVLKMG